MMKKTLALLLCVLLIGFAFVGCNNDNDNGNGDNGDTTVETTPAPATGGAIQEFLDEHQAELEAEMGDLADILGPGSSIAIEAGTGNELVFIFTFGPDADMDEAGELLGELLGGLGFIFEMVADEIADDLDLDYAIVTVRYLDANGGVLAEESFRSN